MHHSLPLQRQDLVPTRQIFYFSPSNDSFYPGNTVYTYLSIPWSYSTWPILEPHRGLLHSFLVSSDCNFPFQLQSADLISIPLGYYNYVSRCNRVRVRVCDHIHVRTFRMLKTQ